MTVRNVPEDWNHKTVEQLNNNLQENLKHQSVFEEFLNRYRVENVSNVKELFEQDAKLCISQSTVKWIIDRAHSRNFQLKKMDCVYYNRYNPGVPSYPIYKYAFVFTQQDSIIRAVIPTKGVQVQAWMIDNLETCIKKHKPSDVEELILRKDAARPGIIKELKEDIALLTAKSN